MPLWAPTFNMGIPSSPHVYNFKNNKSLIRAKSLNLGKFTIALEHIRYPINDHFISKHLKNSSRIYHSDAYCGGQVLWESQLSFLVAHT